jgi:hypothetical protein
MPGRTHRTKHAFRLAPGDQRDGLFEGTGRKSRGPKCPLGHCRIGIKRSQTLIRSRGEDVIEVSRIVDAVKCLPAHQSRLTNHPPLKALVLPEMPQNCLPPLRALRMTILHPVGIAIVMSEQNRFHGH